MSTTPPTAPILTQPSDCLLMGVGRQHTGGMVIMLLRGARCRMAEEGRDDADMLGIVQRDRRGGTIAKKCGGTAWPMVSSVARRMACRQP